MKKIKSNYVLDSMAEADRLDQQSRTKGFDFKKELQFLKIQNGQRVLDAGCGSGIVTDYLSKMAKGLDVVGCDFSHERIEIAQKKYGSDKVRFEQKDLLHLDASGNHFDVIICRFVLRHFAHSKVKTVLDNLLKILNPGGTLYCVDIEGMLADIYPASSFLNKSLQRIRNSDHVDFQVGSKMPKLFLEMGLSDVDWHISTSLFKDKDLLDEIENLKQTFENADSFLRKVLKGKKNVDQFCREYFFVLQMPGHVHYYNKVIAFGTKPKRKLILVK